jgi:hypothetical protein
MTEWPRKSPDVGELALTLLKGGILYHEHYGWERGGGQEAVCRVDYDPVLIAQSAAEAGMRAVVLRNLYFNSTGDAHLVQRMVPEIEVYGGIFLNSDIGGINPTAVDTAMTYAEGARFVCGATDNAAHGARQAGVSEDEIYADPVRYVTPFQRNGEIKPGMLEILDTIATYDVIYETGSLSPEEILVMVKAAREAGVNKILVTHPTPWFCGMTMDQMKEAIDMGALIEFTWMFYTHSMSYMARRYGWGRPGHLVPNEPVGDAYDQIKELGAENCVMSTDFGTLELPLGVEGLREFIFCMLDLGMEADEIRLMIRDNLETLMGLDPWEPPAEEQELESESTSV